MRGNWGRKSRAIWSPSFRPSVDIDDDPVNTLCCLNPKGCVTLWNAPPGNRIWAKRPINRNRIRIKFLAGFKRGRHCQIVAPFFHGSRQHLKRIFVGGKFFTTFNASSRLKMSLTHTHRNKFHSEELPQSAFTQFSRLLTLPAGQLEQ